MDEEPQASVAWHVAALVAGVLVFSFSLWRAMEAAGHFHALWAGMIAAAGSSTVRVAISLARALREAKHRQEAARFLQQQHIPPNRLLDFRRGVGDGLR